MVKVGRIPYISAEPLYFDMARRGIILQDCLPSEMASAAQKGEIDAGPVPLMDCSSLMGRFRYLSGFCIAAIAGARSVNLYSTVPIQELGGAHIAITGEAAAAFQLLRVLLFLKYQVKPAAFVGLDDSHDARLLIGDQGLRYRRGMRGYPHKYDLGTEWHQWTGLPFVFARWVVREGLDPKEVSLVEDALYSGLQDWADGLHRVSETRPNLGMHPHDILEYTQGLRYFMGVPEQRAIDLFQQYLGQTDAT